MIDTNQLRDMFASLAMQALINLSARPDCNGGVNASGDSIASSASCVGWSEDSETVDENDQPLSYAALIAGSAYEIANAMLAERVRIDSKEGIERVPSQAGREGGTE